MGIYSVQPPTPREQALLEVGGRSAHRKHGHSSARSRPAPRAWSQALLGPVTAPSAHLITPNPTGERLRTLLSTPCPLPH